MFLFKFIIVRQLGKRCSRDAVVTAQARLPERQMTEILAEEESMYYPVLCSIIIMRQAVIKPNMFGDALNSDFVTNSYVESWQWTSIPSKNPIVTLYGIAFGIKTNVLNKVL